LSHACGSLAGSLALAPRRRGHTQRNTTTAGRIVDIVIRKNVA
jgi:hypothetical protein